MDEVLVLKALHGKLLCKRWVGKVKTDYDRCYLYDAHPRIVSSLEDLARLTERLRSAKDCCIVRGKLAGQQRRGIRRTYRQPDSAICQQARSWLMIDFDKLPAPAGLDMRVEPAECIEHAIATLPDEFADASCWWHASGSAGMDGLIRAHLWFWLTRPLDDWECKAWLASSPVDLAIYQPVQPHYTADPLFEGDARDPLKRRSGFRRGLDESVSPPETIERKSTIHTGNGDGRIGEGGSFEAHLARLGDDKDGFHDPLMSAACAYVATHGVLGQDFSAVAAKMVEAASAAPALNGRANKDRYLSVPFCEAMLAWAALRQVERYKATWPEREPYASILRELSRA